MGYFRNAEHNVSLAAGWKAGKYNRDGLEKVLYDVLGEETFGNLLGRVMVPAYEVNSSKTIVFDSKNSAHARYKVYQVVCGSCSAPTYFPALELDGMTLVDGGFTANNPAKILYEKAREEYAKEDIVMVSLGTGQMPSTKVEKQDTGLFWAT